MVASLQFTITRYFLLPKMILMDSLTPKTYREIHQIHHSKTDADEVIFGKGAAAILDAMLKYTFLPHIWNVYPSFLESSMGPLQGSRVKIRGHMIAHRTTLSPRTINLSGRIAALARCGLLLQTGYSVVCLLVDLSVSNDREPCKNG